MRRWVQCPLRIPSLVSFGHGAGHLAWARGVAAFLSPSVTAFGDVVSAEVFASG